MSRSGIAWHGQAGQAWRDRVRCGAARYGMAGHGVAGGSAFISVQRKFQNSEKACSRISPASTVNIDMMMISTVAAASP